MELVFQKSGERVLIRAAHIHWHAIREGVVHLPKEGRE
jgi:hypothetical protein